VLSSMASVYKFQIYSELRMQETAVKSIGAIPGSESTGGNVAAQHAKRLFGRVAGNLTSARSVFNEIVVVSLVVIILRTSG
jgi:hypothetical protein